MKTHAVLMAGGLGSRLWPLSRDSHPKQFIQSNNSYSLFQQTVLRNNYFDKLTVIVSKTCDVIVSRQLSEIKINAQIIIEPEGRGTAPCALIAALIAKKNEVIILLPSDHNIDSQEKYIERITDSVNSAVKNPLNIIMIGVKPSAPHTGFGYIKAGNIVDKVEYNVAEFVEKPSAIDAQSYINSGDYFWNLGIFVFTPDAMINVARILDPSMLKFSKKSLELAIIQNKIIYLDAACYKKLENNSVDKAFIEKSVDKINLIQVDFTWRDMGSWASMWDVADKDSNDNLLDGDIIANDVKGSYILSKEKLTAVVGLEDIVVVNTKDATLIANRNNTEHIKTVVNTLNDNARKEVQTALEIHDIWGSYKVISHSAGCQIVNLTIRPGQKFPSTQYTNILGNLVMVSGEAEIRLGKKVKYLRQNDSMIVSADKNYTICNNTANDISLIAIKSA